MYAKKWILKGLLRRSKRRTESSTSWSISKRTYYDTESNLSDAFVFLYPSAGIVGKIVRKHWPSERSEITPELITEYANELYDELSFEDWEAVLRTNLLLS